MVDMNRDFDLILKNKELLKAQLYKLICEKKDNKYIYPLEIIDIITYYIKNDFHRYYTSEYRIILKKGNYIAYISNIIYEIYYYKCWRLAFYIDEKTENHIVCEYRIYIIINIIYDTNGHVNFDLSWNSLSPHDKISKALLEHYRVDDNITYSEYLFQMSSFKLNLNVYYEINYQERINMYILTLKSVRDRNKKKYSGNSIIPHELWHYIYFEHIKC